MADPGFARVRDLYAEAPWAARAHVRLRWWSCPFAAVAAAVPRAGQLLDFGCGHGLLAATLALGSPDRRVLGVDVAPDKIRVAERAARRAAARGAALRFERLGPGQVPPGPWDAVTVVDVLYLLEPAVQQELLRTLAGRLTPGGVLVVKEMAGTPRWKFLWAVIQETVSVRLLKITHGSRLWFVAPATLAGWLRAIGLEVSEHPLHRGFVHPHHLIVARRPAPAARAAG